jgi:hypothetical protein
MGSLCIVRGNGESLKRWKQWDGGWRYVFSLQRKLIAEIIRTVFRNQLISAEAPDDPTKVSRDSPTKILSGWKTKHTHPRLYFEMHTPYHTTYNAETQI